MDNRLVMKDASLSRPNWWIVAALFVLVLILAREAQAEPSEVVLQTIAMESAAEPASGQALVALTLINRARERGTTPELEAKRPFQFSAWNGGGKWAGKWIRSFYTPQTRQRARNAYYDGLALSVRPEYAGIRHYHAVGVNPAWARGHNPAYAVGHHLFYEGIR